MYCSGGCLPCSELRCLQPLQRSSSPLVGRSVGRQRPWRCPLLSEEPATPLGRCWGLDEDTTEHWWEGAEGQSRMGFGGGKEGAEVKFPSHRLRSDSGWDRRWCWVNSCKELIPCDWRTGEGFYSPPHRFSSLPELVFAKGTVWFAMSPSSVPAWGLNILVAPVVCLVRVKPSSRVIT